CRDPGSVDAVISAGSIGGCGGLASVSGRGPGDRPAGAGALAAGGVRGGGLVGRAYRRGPVRRGHGSGPPVRPWWVRGGELPAELVETPGPWLVGFRQAQSGVAGSPPLPVELVETPVRACQAQSEGWSPTEIARGVWPGTVASNVPSPPIVMVSPETASTYE